MHLYCESCLEIDVPSLSLVKDKVTRQTVWRRLCERCRHFASDEDLLVTPGIDQLPPPTEPQFIRDSKHRATEVRNRIWTSDGIDSSYTTKPEKHEFNRLTSSLYKGVLKHDTNILVLEKMLREGFILYFAVYQGNGLVAEENKKKIKALSRSIRLEFTLGDWFSWPRYETWDLTDSQWFIVQDDSIPVVKVEPGTLNAQRPGINGNESQEDERCGQPTSTKLSEPETLNTQKPGINGNEGQEDERCDRPKLRPNQDQLMTDESSVQETSVSTYVNAETHEIWIEFPKAFAQDEYDRAVEREAAATLMQMRDGQGNQEMADRTKKVRSRIRCLPNSDPVFETPQKRERGGGKENKPEKKRRLC